MATAPISWGICEVPGWGIQLPVHRVLSEMSEMGFPATELGSEGYLPSSPEELSSVLGEHELGLLAAFVQLVLHDPVEADETLRRAEDTAAFLAKMGATYFNTAAVTTYDWAPRQELTEAQWDHVMIMLDRVGEIVEKHGLVHVVHSHVGTIIDKAAEVQRVLDNSTALFVLDTAHLAVGGYDPVDFVDRYPDRVGLVHVKDADLDIAARLNSHELTLMEAVQAGIFPPVGRGDLDIGHVIASLERSGFAGWYVLEQDVAITGAEPGVGEGPIEGVRTSVEYLRGLEQQLAA
ncbi:MAG: sugar phosphate isomerase/epimerase family protein [Acidimicrobiales bacterium]